MKYVVYIKSIKNIICAKQTENNIINKCDNEVPA